MRLATAKRVVYYFFPFTDSYLAYRKLSNLTRILQAFMYDMDP